MLRRFEQQGLTAAQQMLHLRNSRLFAGAGAIRGQAIAWCCEVRPTPLSRRYSLRLEWAEGEAPQIFVDDPDLVLLADGARLPHVYTQRPTRLCLYLPRAGQFRQTDRLDQTVLPWAVMWLAYFEDWLARGCTDWQGGGEHPSDVEDEPRARRRALASQYRQASRRGDG
jgi:hypothetical protein